MLLDGFKIVIYLEKSRGSIYIMRSHPALDRSLRLLWLLPGRSTTIPISTCRGQTDLLRAAQTKIANSDIYSEAYAGFVETFSRVAGLPPLETLLLHRRRRARDRECLKAAMDWKVRKNLAAGRGERGTEILHFQARLPWPQRLHAEPDEHDPRKTDYFAKFPWPRVSTPRSTSRSRKPSAGRCHRARKETPKPKS